MRISHTLFFAMLALVLAACSDGGRSHGDNGGQDAEHVEAAPEPEKGPHRGRMLRDGNFTLELAIFETGVPPEYRAWLYQDNKPLAPETTELTVKLTRLGDVVDTIRFKPQGDFLRGDSVIYEPHSFVVSIEARHEGKTHTWQYDSFEGRTAIEPEVAAALEIQTEVAGPVQLKETLKVYGKVVPDPERQRTVQARFDGVITSVHASLGDKVTQGQPLFTIESNESLKTHTISAPISGIVAERSAHPGEQTQGRALMRIVDSTTVWVELAVFPQDLSRVKPGAEVTLHWGSDGVQRQATINRIDLEAEASQAVHARVKLDNRDGALRPGVFVTGDVVVATHDAPLAVKRAGLQGFRDFTVVFAQVGNQYEVRMLELGSEAGEWVEVLGGIEPGTRYVTENSYVIKADIEKSGAAHDH